MRETVSRAPSFADHNLRWNPFGEPTRDERARLASLDADSLADWVARLRAGDYALQFVGDSGRGKSTCLFALAKALPGLPYVRAIERRWTSFPRADGLLLDEAQFIPAWRRRRLFANCRVIAIGTHVDLSSELGRWFRDVATVTFSEPSKGHLRAILDARLDWARLGSGPVPRIADVTIVELMERHGSDLRAIEDELYERFQALRDGALNGEV